jgi:hypothetical protein
VTKYLTVVSLILLYSVSLWADPICVSVGPHDLRSDVAVFQDLKLASYQLIVLNENHFESALAAEPEVVSKIKRINPAVNCLFKEYPPGVEPKSREGYGKAFDPDKNLWPVAFDSGISVIFVDSKKSFSPNDIYQNIAARNADMAERIKSRFDSGDCKAGIFIVGKAHNFSSIGRPIWSIRQILRHHSFRVVSINLVDLHFAITKDHDPAYAYVYPGNPGVEEISNTYDPDYSACFPAIPPNKWFARGFVNSNSSEACATVYHSARGSNTIPRDWGSLCDFDATLFY